MAGLSEIGRVKYKFFMLLIWLRVPRPIYYRLLDLLTDNNGWRPLSMRYPQHFSE